ncbi:MAG: tyrosine-protein kinase [Thermoleophilaceae bacterium]|jgi:capsular exopolysaccharide synthesis family protein|nr:tyrosine-protein kinase [Thermoleophilaceae bacterium]
MNAPQPTPGVGNEWLNPSVDEQGLARYATTIRERKWLILATVLLTTLAAVVYLATAPKVYQAESDLLITPVPGSDPVYTATGLIHDTSDPTRDVETASRLITNVDVARRVKATLHDSRTPAQLLDAVTVQPVAQSNIVSIVAEGSSPKAAQALANTFAQQAVADRTQIFHQQLDRSIADLKKQIPPANPNTPTTTTDPNSLPAQLVRMQTLRLADDPTMRVQTLADPPASPSSPKAKLSIAAGLLAGLVLGVGGAFALQVLDPRLRREEQLRRLYGLPILARIPKDSRAHGAGALAPEMLSPSTIEAYRTLRATLAASRGREQGSTSILVTSSSPSEGKTTSAINLASSLALAGNKVILIEADLRRPAIAKALGIEPRHGTGSVLLETVELEDALETTRAYGNYLQVLCADYSGAASGWMADRLFLPSAQKLVTDAKRLADYVVIDSPPLSEVIDALALAQRADEVLVVVRLGKTHLTKLAHLAELLSRHAIRPVGFAVVGAQTATEGYYYTAPGGQKSGGQKSGSGRDGGSTRTRPREPDVLTR